MIVGCSSKPKTSEEVYDILLDNDYKILFDYQFGMIKRDIDGNCYGYQGVEIDCGETIIFKDEPFLPWISVKTNDGDKIGFFYSTFTGTETLSISYANSEPNIGYSMSKEDIFEYSMISGKDSCSVIHRDDKKIFESLNKCDKEEESFIKDFENSMNNSLKKLGITKDELYTFMKWFEETYIKPDFDKIKQSNGEVKLTPDEVYDRIKQSDLQTVPYLEGVALKSEDEVIFIEILADNPIRLTYMNTEVGVKMLSYFIKQDELMATTGNCTYSYYKSAAINGTTCSEDDIESFLSLKSKLYTWLKTQEINLAEIINWGDEYYKLYILPYINK